MFRVGDRIVRKKAGWRGKIVYITRDAYDGDLLHIDRDDGECGSGVPLDSRLGYAYKTYAYRVELERKNLWVGGDRARKEYTNY
jgi:hypothetical protein